MKFYHEIISRVYTCIRAVVTRYMRRETRSYLVKNRNVWNDQEMCTSVCINRVCSSFSCISVVFFRNFHTAANIYAKWQTFNEEIKYALLSNFYFFSKQKRIIETEYLSKKFPSWLYCILIKNFNIRVSLCCYLLFVRYAYYASAI